MTIELISEEDYKTLLSIYTNFKSLSLQNRSYEGINKSLLTTEELNKFAEVETLIKKAIKGFRRFQNFRLSNKGEIQLRFQYNYNHGSTKDLPFTGVGYILLTELLNGFVN
jgi:hypothetical protein